MDPPLGRLQRREQPGIGAGGGRTEPGGRRVHSCRPQRAAARQFDHAIPTVLTTVDGIFWRDGLFEPLRALFARRHRQHDFVWLRGRRSCRLGADGLRMGRVVSLRRQCMPGQRRQLSAEHAGCRRCHAGRRDRPAVRRHAISAEFVQSVRLPDAARGVYRCADMECSHRRYFIARRISQRDVSRPQPNIEAAHTLPTFQFSKRITGIPLMSRSMREAAYLVEAERYMLMNWIDEANVDLSWVGYNAGRFRSLTFGGRRYDGQYMSSSIHRSNAWASNAITPLAYLGPNEPAVQYFKNVDREQLRRGLQLPIICRNRELSGRRTSGGSINPFQKYHDNSIDRLGVVAG